MAGNRSLSAFAGHDIFRGYFTTRSPSAYQHGRSTLFIDGRRPTATLRVNTQGLDAQPASAAQRHRFSGTPILRQLGTSAAPAGARTLPPSPRSYISAGYHTTWHGTFLHTCYRQKDYFCSRHHHQQQWRTQLLISVDSHFPSLHDFKIPPVRPLPAAVERLSFICAEYHELTRFTVFHTTSRAPCSLFEATYRSFPAPSSQGRREATTDDMMPEAA